MRTALYRTSKVNNLGAFRGGKVERVMTKPKPETKERWRIRIYELLVSNPQMDHLEIAFRADCPLQEVINVISNLKAEAAKLSS